MAKRPQLSAETILLSYLDQHHWRLETNLPHWLTIKVPCWGDVQFLVNNFKSVLTGWASAQPLYFQYQGHYLAQLSSQGDLMDISIAGIEINRQLLDVFGMMLANPDRSIGLVRLSDERQISVSGGAGGKYLVGASLDQVTQWKRADYWHPEDLGEFNQTWRREMSVGSSQWFEYRYRSFDPLANNPGPHQCDYTFITRYRLIQGPDSVYHVAENLDMTAIAP